MSIIQDFVQYINDYENHFHDADPGQSNATIEILLQAEKRPVNTYWHITKQDDIDRQLYTWFCGLSILVENLYDSTKLNLTLRAISRVIKDDYQKTYSIIENALRNWTRASDNGKKERRVFLDAVNELFQTLSTKRIPDLELLYADFIEQEEQEIHNLKIHNLKTQQAQELADSEKISQNSDFEITEAQVFYKGKDLRFPVGQTIEVFQKLYENIGKTVAYKNLSHGSKNEASDYLRKEKNKIAHILKSNKIPFSIDSMRNAGYCLRPHKKVKKKEQ